MQWIRENNMKPGDPTDEGAVAKLMRGGMEWAVCPDGGKISFNPVGVPPTCSLHGIQRKKVRVGWFGYTFKPSTPYHALDQHLAQEERILPVIWAAHDPLSKCTQLANLIIKCKTEVDGERINHKVCEIWKGTFDPDLLRPPRPAGYLCTWFCNPDSRPPSGQDSVFFFFPKVSDNLRSNTFGMCDYYESFLWTNEVVTLSRFGVDRVVTIEEFKQAVLLAE